MWAVLISFFSALIASFAHGKYMHVHAVCMCKYIYTCTSFKLVDQTVFILDRFGYESWHKIGGGHFGSRFRFLLWRFFDLGKTLAHLWKIAATSCWPFFGFKYQLAREFTSPPKQVCMISWTKRCGIELIFLMTFMFEEFFLLVLYVERFSCQAVFNWRNRTFCGKTCAKTSLNVSQIPCLWHVADGPCSLGSEDVWKPSCRNTSFQHSLLIVTKERLPKNIGKVWNGDDDVHADDDDDEDEDEDADDDVPIFESTGGVWIQATFPGGLCRKKQTPRISWLMKWIVHHNRPLWSPRMHVSYQCICLKWSSFKFLKSMALRFICCNDPLECQDKAEFHFTLEHAFAGAGWLWFGNILLDFGKWGYSGYGCFKNHDMITEMDMGLTSDISHTNRWLPDQADPSWGWSDGGFRWRCIIQNSSSHAQL